MADLEVLDTCGLRCPLPVIKTEAKLRKMAAGQKLRVLANDPLATIDIPHFCREAGHHVDVQEQEDGTCVFIVTARDKIA